MVREACVTTLLEAYEEAGLQGLCGEGRFEVAVDSVRSANVEKLLESRISDPRPSHRA